MSRRKTRAALLLLQEVCPSSRAVQILLEAAEQCWEAAGQCWKQCSDDGLNSAKWEWPLLVVDWGDKSSHRLRVLRAAICETMENQAASIIRYTLLTNPFRQFFSLSLEFGNFPIYGEAADEEPSTVWKDPSNAYGQEQFLITLFNFDGNTGNLKQVREINSQD